MSQERMSQHDRRSALQEYARQELDGTNQAQAFVNIVDKAVELSATEADPYIRHEIVARDLFVVLVGEGPANEDRNKGAYFVGNEYVHGHPSTGFRPEFQFDEFGSSDMGQVQHAAAGLLVPILYDVPPVVMEYLEDEPQDDLLYDAIFPVSHWFDSGRLANLGVGGMYDRLDIPRSPAETLEAIENHRALAQKTLDELPARILEAICDGSCTLPRTGEAGASAFSMERDAAGFNFERESASSLELGIPDHRADALEGGPKDDEAEVGQLPPDGGGSVAAWTSADLPKESLPDDGFDPSTASPHELEEYLGQESLPEGDADPQQALDHALEEIEAGQSLLSGHQAREAVAQQSLPEEELPEGDELPDAGYGAGDTGDDAGDRVFDPVPADVPVGDGGGAGYGADDLGYDHDPADWDSGDDRGAGWAWALRSSGGGT